MSDEPDLPGVAWEQRELLARLQAVIGAKDAEIVMLRAELGAARERERRLEVRIAELERRPRTDSSDSGTPSSREPIGASERRWAARRRRDASERERRQDRKLGGQPGHPGKGMSRDLDPDEQRAADPPAQCRRCGMNLDGTVVAGQAWAQVWDVTIMRNVVEYLLPGLECPCCGTVTTARPPAGAHAGSAATSTQQPATASPRSKPFRTPSSANPGCPPSRPRSPLQPEQQPETGATP